jgi:hypothetical protein
MMTRMRRRTFNAYLFSGLIGCIGAGGCSTAAALGGNPFEVLTLISGDGVHPSNPAHRHSCLSQVPDRVH